LLSPHWDTEGRNKLVHLDIEVERQEAKDAFESSKKTFDHLILCNEKRIQKLQALESTFKNLDDGRTIDKHERVFDSEKSQVEELISCGAISSTLGSSSHRLGSFHEVVGGTMRNAREDDLRESWDLVQKSKNVELSRIGLSLAEEELNKIKDMLTKLEIAKQKKRKKGKKGSPKKSSKEKSGEDDEEIVMVLILFISQLFTQFLVILVER